MYESEERMGQFKIYLVAHLCVCCLFNSTKECYKFVEPISARHSLREI